MKLNNLLLSLIIPVLIGRAAANTLAVDDSLPVTSTLQVSQLMYSFATLRSIVAEHEETFQKDKDSLTERKKKRHDIVRFEQPELIITKNSASHKFPATKMKNPVTAVAVLEFLNKNKKWLRQVEGGDMEFVPGGDNAVETFMAQTLEKLKAGFDADIVEFDDEFAEHGLKSTLVYSIVVNRNHKRITVIFRGSVTLTDWLVDFAFSKTTPRIIDKFTTRSPKIHKGFAGYLLDDTKAENYSKVYQIIDVLEQLYAYKDEAGRDYSDYELYITGHSLDGALTQLLAFVLAGSEEASFIPKPINAISFASPIVGDKNYLEEFQKLEKDNKLRHIRVSNNNDVVPYQVPGFRQTGVNFHVKEGKKMEVKYLNPKSLLSQCRFKSSIPKHGLGSYFSRLYAKDKHGNLLNGDVLRKTIEQLYEDYAGVAYPNRGNTVSDYLWSFARKITKKTKHE